MIKWRVMIVCRRRIVAAAFSCAVLVTGLLFAFAAPLLAEGPATPKNAAQPGKSAGAPASVCEPSRMGSPYIPVDSWVYPAMLRLYSLGYVDPVFLGLRPWTRASLMHMLEQAGDLIENSDAGNDPGAGQAREIYNALNRELHSDMEGPCGAHEGNTHIESVYTLARGISGTPLHDSFHLGSTIVNDYGRPFENGFNNYSGASGYASAGRFTLYVRGEFQGAPSAVGYSASLAQALSTVDSTNYFIPSSTPPYGPTTAVYNQATIPQGPIPTTTSGRFLEAYLSYQYLDHVFSIGKQDQWLGPAQGASMAFSNNAQNFYAFEINRIEPLNVPLLSRVTGPFRYEFLVGALRGHTLMVNPAYEANPAPTTANVINPGDPWVHVEKISFRPTKDFELGFERTAPPTPRTATPNMVRMILVRVSPPSTSLTGCRSCVTGSRSTRIQRCTTTFLRLMLLGGQPIGRAFIFPMFPGLQSSTCALKRPRLIRLHRRYRAGDTASSCTGNRSSDRATPTRASCSATGSDARIRAARLGSRIT
jgi:hypothetical protein